MGAVKKCGVCGEVKAHHDESDVYCMECEMEINYPDSGNAGLIGLLSMSTTLSHSLDEFKESVESIEIPSFWQSMKNMFKW